MKRSVELGRAWRAWMGRTLACLPLAVLVSCSSDAEGIAPPDIVYGEDVCVQCNMIISDPKFASGYVIESGLGEYQSLAFDDVGSLLVHAAAHPEHEIVAWYVHDYGTEEWLDATGAYFVISAELRTPMAHGLAAHATLDAAQIMADELNGDVLDWDSLRTRFDSGQLPFAGGMGG